MAVDARSLGLHSLQPVLMWVTANVPNGNIVTARPGPDLCARAGTSISPPSRLTVSLVSAKPSRYSTGFRSPLMPPPSQFRQVPPPATAQVRARSAPTLLQAQSCPSPE